MMTSSSVYISILIAFLFVQNTLVASQDYGEFILFVEETDSNFAGKKSPTV